MRIFSVHHFSCRTIQIAILLHLFVLLKLRLIRCLLFGVTGIIIILITSWFITQVLIWLKFLANSIVIGNDGVSSGLGYLFGNLSPIALREPTAWLGRSLLKFIKSSFLALYNIMLRIVVRKEHAVFEFFLRGALRDHVILPYFAPQIMILDDHFFNSGRPLDDFWLKWTGEHLSSYVLCFFRFFNIHETLVNLLSAGSMAKLMLIRHSLKFNLVSKDTIIFFNWIERGFSTIVDSESRSYQTATTLIVLRGKFL